MAAVSHRAKKPHSGARDAGRSGTVMRLSSLTEVFAMEVVPLPMQLFCCPALHLIGQEAGGVVGVL